MNKFLIAIAMTAVLCGSNVGTASAGHLSHQVYRNGVHVPPPVRYSNGYYSDCRYAGTCAGSRYGHSRKERKAVRIIQGIIGGLLVLDAVTDNDRRYRRP